MNSNSSRKPIPSQGHEQRKFPFHRERSPILTERSPNSSCLMTLSSNTWKTARRIRVMDWGTLMEDSARIRYQDETGSEVLDAPFVPLEGFDKFAGGSPDGIIRSGGIIEIKCPFNPAVHQKHFLYEKADDLKDDNLQYYCQIQYNMICVERETGVEVSFGDFVSYDPRTSRSKQLKVLRIPKDEEMQHQLLERTNLAVEYFKEKIDQISNAKAIV